MAHVTFIHGIANKPEPEELLKICRRGLSDPSAASDEINLGASGVTSSMLYWADFMYASPDPDTSGYEGVSSVDPGSVEASIETHWKDAETTAEQQWLAALEAKFNFSAPPPEGNEEYQPSPGQAGPQFERIPLPWFIKRRFLKTFTRDVHHYLFNVSHSPRPGETYRIQDDIRARVISKLAEIESQGSPHIVIAHSMGTVIMYDCLKRVPDCPKIDGLITVGCPLGIDEVQDKLHPEWTRESGFPFEKLAGRWVNIYDPLDVVSGLDPRIANDFKENGEEKTEDVLQDNNVLWAHSLMAYLRGPHLRQTLREMLGTG